MRHPVRTIALAAIATVLLTGCTKVYPFQLLLTVESEADGRALEGVTAVLKTTSGDANRLGMDYGSQLGDLTDSSGRFTHDFQIVGSPDNDKHWYLKLQKDGFEPVVVDIRPDPVPNSHDKTPIPVTVKMKALPPAPAP
jgi:hypothetical protein